MTSMSERRKCLIDGLNRIPGFIPRFRWALSIRWQKLPVDDADKFCAWCLEEFEYEGQTVMMAPASGFYTTPGLGKNEVRMAYVLKKRRSGEGTRGASEGAGGISGKNSINELQ